MSILYGFVNLDGQPAEPRMLENMGSALKNYTSDAQSSFVIDNVAMGFKNQYITEESHFEKLPYCDSNEGLFFVCDAIIDNREELSGLLGLKLRKELTDSHLIYESYKKWGKDCTRYLLGDFAFVVYDKKHRQVQLIRDHMGKRLLYYRIDKHRIFFSTLIKPLVDPWANKQKPKINEQYLIHFLASDENRHEYISGYTVYQDINYVQQASCLTVSHQSISNEVFWDPRDIEAGRQYSKSNYIEEFLSIFTDAVHCRIRADGDIGVLLSGGLDSSAVACVAASILRKQNRELHTYTSIPVQGFTDWSPKNVISDESAAVIAMQSAYPNMDVHLIDSKGKNPLNAAGRILEVFEQPYKFVENSYWLDDIIQTAGHDGCRIVLSGVFGNSTISYGEPQITFFEHIMRFRLFSFIKDVNAFCLCNEVSRKKVLSRFARDFRKSIVNPDIGSFTTDIVKSEFLHKYDVNSTMCFVGYSKKPYMRDREYRRHLFHPTLTHQAASAMAKSCLSSNVCERDPTSDKRIIEFCLKLPYDYYFESASGQSRSLIRRAMTGIVPDGILKNKYYGQQAADWLERIKPQWKDFIQGFIENYQLNNPLSEYLNYQDIAELLSRNSDVAYSFETAIAVRNIITIDNCIKFLNML